MPISVKFNGDFTNFDLNSIFYSHQTFDFNDRYYGTQAKENDFFIITHDADFSNINNCNINIITMNKKLLGKLK